MELEHARKGAAILDLISDRPWERVLLPMMQCSETRGGFQRSNEVRKLLAGQVDQYFTERNDV